jgi:threonine aldolase
MNFASDNWAGASPKVLEALAHGSAGIAPAYGADDLTREVKARLAALFGHEVGAFFVATGTSANSLCLAALCPPYGAVYAHDEAHIIGDEGGASEFVTQGARLIGIPGVGGKIGLADFKAVAGKPAGPASRFPLPSTLSLTQASECGTVYREEEVAALSEAAAAFGLKVHMDGARFANAFAFLCSLRGDMTPGDITWKAGVDALSLGFTKNGALLAEAVVLFDPERADEVEWRRKRSGQVLSKARLVAAQLLAMLEDDHWLDLARHANRMALMLGHGLVTAGHRLGFDIEANEVFAVLPKAMIPRLRQEGALFYEYPRASLAADRRAGPDAELVRLVTSFATMPEEVEQFIKLASQI